jgi:hypothetical protein
MDPSLIVSTLKARCLIDESRDGSCWVWRGARRGRYGFTGRAATNRLAHRVMAWASLGCEGPIVEMPHIHHTCGVSLCLNPVHLVPVTALANILERSARNALLHEISILRHALEAIDPAHPILCRQLQLGSSAEVPTRSIVNESSRIRLNRLRKNSEYLGKRQAHAQQRFAQVVEVDSLVARGMKRLTALKRAGVSRSVYDDWKPRLNAALRESEESS